MLCDLRSMWRRCTVLLFMLFCLGLKICQSLKCSFVFLEMFRVTTCNYSLIVVPNYGESVEFNFILAYFAWNSAPIEWHWSDSFNHIISLAIISRNFFRAFTRSMARNGNIFIFTGNVYIVDSCICVCVCVGFCFLFFVARFKSIINSTERNAFCVLCVQSLVASVVVVVAVFFSFQLYFLLDQHSMKGNQWNLYWVYWECSCCNRTTNRVVLTPFTTIFNCKLQLFQSPENVHRCFTALTLSSNSSIPHF